MKRAMLCIMAAVILLAGLIVPAGAESVLDNYATCRFRKNYAVYSGPGMNYVRASNGKASMGGGGVCRLYGVEGQWVLIGYGFTNGGYRIGYISADAMDNIYDVKGNINYYLTFHPYTAYADDSCLVTDDPVINNKTVYTIPRGTAVTVLCSYGSTSAYVEVRTPDGPMRGFVLSKHLLGWSAATATPRPTRRPTPTPTYYYPYYPTYPTATPASGIPNTYYHPSSRSEWLPAAQSLRLQGSWPVYSGPGTYYFRANNNKATMGGGVCRVYGIEGSWVLIGYELSNGNYRIGYISVSALPQMGLSIPYLDFQGATRRVVYSVDLIDDPVRTLAPVVSLSAGTYVVFLGYLWENGQSWAYVEVLTGGSFMRGFVPSWCLQQ